MAGVSENGSDCLGEAEIQVRQQLIEVGQRMDGISSAFAAASSELVAQCKLERSSLRREICARSPGQGVRTSFIYLTLVRKQAGVEFRWLEARSYWNNDDSWSGNASSRRLKVGKEGVPAPSALLRGAHPDERQLLLEHRGRVAMFRESWKRLVSLRTALRVLNKRLLVDQDLDAR